MKITWAHSDSKCVAGLVNLISSKPQAQQSYVEDFEDIKSAEDVMPFGNGMAWHFFQALSYL